jgi:RNA polymerase sigma factor (sigma-70 family)
MSNWLRDCFCYCVMHADQTNNKKVIGKQIHFDSGRIVMALNNAMESGKNNALASEGEISSGFRGTDTNALPPASPRDYSTAFENIWEAHAKQLLRVTQRITNNREDAEDALQDSFLRAYAHRRSFDGRSSLATWLTRIAINSALLLLRKRASASQLSIDDAGGYVTNHESVEVADHTPNPEALYAQLEQQEILRSGIRALPPAIRQTVELQALEDRSVKETAERMGLSISATKSRIFHAKAALRKSLQPKFVRPARATQRLQLSPA